MFKRILVIFEDERVSEQALVYSRELSFRMDSEVTLLVLVPMEFKQGSMLESRRKTINRIKNHMGEKLTELSSEFVKKGIAVSVAIRVGDPAQELLKFLAERLPFQTIIWGSSEEMPDSQPGNLNHWMRKIKDVLECPIFTVKSKNTAPSDEKPIKQKGA